MKVSILFAVNLMLLQRYLPRVCCNCAMYGCTSSASFTCPTDFYIGSFNADLAVSYEDPDLKPAGSGCVTNVEKIACPMVGSKIKYMLIFLDATSIFDFWNVTMKALPTLPFIDVYGAMFTTDGDELCGFDRNRNPLGPCIKMEPITGPLFDLIIVAEKFIYLLYKCGFMVAYTTGGIPYASIWLNTTVEGMGNGTFIPLGNPAVSGERVYIIALFKPFGSNSTSGVKLRVYALDIRTIMVKRIKVIWHYDFTLKGDGSVPYTKETPFPDVANIICENGMVVASVNYRASLYCSGEKCRGDINFSNSLLVSLIDNGDSYSLNFLKTKLQPFQAVAYASPSFTVPSSPDPVEPPSMWVSWVDADEYSVIEKLDIATGNSISKIDEDSLKEISVTSKMSIFYNDQHTQEKLRPLVFGYSYKSKTYIAAVDVSLENPELRFSVELPGDAPVVGQITTVGKGRDTWMIVTTTKGLYFYLLFADN